MTQKTDSVGPPPPPPGERQFESSFEDSVLQDIGTYDLVSFEGVETSLR